MFHKNKFVTVLKGKEELLNSHFATHFSLISDTSKLPLYVQYLTEDHLSCVSFSQDEIAKVIQNLNPNGLENITVRILKVCVTSNYKPLEIICIETGVFPPKWKKGNINPMHKKETNKQ